ncbi:MAG: ABC transporter permease subunit [Candidatus Micrarchaeia archaeon]
MNVARVWAIVGKDLADAFSSAEIYGPMLGIPLFFAILLPLFTVYVSQYAGTELAAKLLGIEASIIGGNVANRLAFIVYFSINILGPIFLTMPIITSSVIAADCFVGEKESKTAESLLTSPITKGELFLGKILASAIPAFGITIAVFLIFGGIINYFTNLYYHTLVFPNTDWYLMLADAPALIMATIGLVVIVSSKVKSIKEAQQISALIALPIFIIPFVSVFALVSLSPEFFLGLLLVLAVVALLVIYLGIRTFKKERLIAA